MEDEEKNGRLSGSMSSSTPESVKVEADNLANDLIDILTMHNVPLHLHPDEYKELIIDLSIYCVNRDYRVMRHGVALGGSDS